MFEHDDARMARGEPCTRVLRFVPGPGPGEEIVGFHCKPRWGQAPDRFTAATDRNPDGMRVLTHYQFAGDEEAHGVPYQAAVAGIAGQLGRPGMDRRIMSCWQPRYRAFLQPRSMISSMREEALASTACSTLAGMRTMSPGRASTAWAVDGQRRALPPASARVPRTATPCSVRPSASSEGEQGYAATATPGEHSAGNTVLR